MSRYGLLPWPPGDEATPEQIERGLESLRSQTPERYPGWPMKLHGRDGKLCGCELWPSGSEASMLISLADHSLFGNCPNEQKTT